MERAKVRTPRGKPALTPTQAHGKMAFDAISRTISDHQHQLSQAKQTELLTEAANAIRKAVESDELNEITTAKASIIKAIFQELTKK